MKILFVTRRFPPSVGGLERAAYELYIALKDQQQVRLIKWGGSNRALPVIYPWLILCAILQVWFYKPDVIYLQDGLLAPLGAIVKLLSGRPVVISVHGLDVTYPSKFYQRMLRLSLPRMNRIVAGSRWTRQQVLDRYPELPIEIITYGLKDEFYLDSTRHDLLVKISSQIHMPVNKLVQRQILFTAGRLVPRKGVEWFVTNVLPELVRRMPEILYIVAGDGPKKAAIEEAIRSHGLDEHVLLLGQVSNELRNQLYNAANLFIMPNIPILGNGEGFGLVALEASSCGTPIIAADLEGIKDAVTQGKSGYRVPSADAPAFTKMIAGELQKPQLTRSSVRHYVTRTYSWQNTAKHYLEIFDQVK